MSRIEATVIVGATITAGVGPQGPAGVGVPAGGTTGQVLAKTSGADYATGWTTGGGASEQLHVATAIAFDDADLATGITVYTPAAGDILIDAWLEVVAGFVTGTGDACYDIGLLNTNGMGLFNNVYGAPPKVSGSASGDSPVHGGAVATLQDLNVIGVINGVGSPPNYSAFQTNRAVPLTFADTEPLKALISVDGTVAGGAADLAQGSGIVHLLIIPAT